MEAENRGCTCGFLLTTTADGLLTKDLAITSTNSFMSITPHFILL